MLDINGTLLRYRNCAGVRYGVGFRYTIYSVV